MFFCLVFIVLNESKYFIMKKITLLLLFLVHLSFSQSDGDLDVSAIFATGLQESNGCDPSFERVNSDANTVTIKTALRGETYFNTSWLFKRYTTSTSPAKWQNKKIPGGSTISQILSATGDGITIDGLNTTSADGVLTIDNGCAAVTGAKIFASLKFTGFDAVGKDLVTVSITTNPNGALDTATYKTFTYTINLEYDESLSYEKLDYYNFTFAPNPANNTLSLNANEVISNVELYNTLGQKTFSTNIDALNANLDISNLKKGIYLMKATIADKTATYKLIKD